MYIVVWNEMLFAGFDFGLKARWVGGDTPLAVIFRHHEDARVAAAQAGGEVRKLVCD